MASSAGIELSLLQFVFDSLASIVWTGQHLVKFMYKLICSGLLLN